MSRSETTWEGSVGVNYDVEQGHLIKRTVQPDRDWILGQVAEERKHDIGSQRILGGWKVGTIPLNDLPFVLSRYPEFDSQGADAEQRKAALIRFSNDPDMQPYLVKKA